MMMILLSVGSNAISPLTCNGLVISNWILNGKLLPSAKTAVVVVYNRFYIRRERVYVHVFACKISILKGDGRNRKRVHELGLNLACVLYRTQKSVHLYARVCAKVPFKIKHVPFKAFFFFCSNVGVYKTVFFLFAFLAFENYFSLCT